MATRKRVLIVEDNADWRILVRLILERAGYEIFEAATGTEGVDRASSVHPDLILMDLGLPGMSGNEAIECLKKHPATRDIPVIVQTAWSAGIHIDNALQAGADEILHKPIDLTTLLAVLRKYLSAENEPTAQAAA